MTSQPERISCRGAGAPAALALALGLAGCAPIPAVDALPPPPATLAPPTLLPLDPLLAQAAVPPQATQATAEALAARGAALRRRVGQAP